MRLVIQRVLRCSVSVNGIEVSRIGRGMLILLGLTKGDDMEAVKKYSGKALRLRLWHEILKEKLQETQEISNSLPPLNTNTDNTTNATTKADNTGEESKEEEKQSPNDNTDNKTAKRERKTWHTNVVDNNYDIMVVSQFTLYGILKGNKPDFHGALNNKEALSLYESFVNELKKNYKSERIQMGKFGEYMHVDYVNDGPVTLIIDSEKDK